VKQALQIHLQPNEGEQDKISTFVWALVR
jgi:hypothetical protein